MRLMARTLVFVAFMLTLGCGDDPGVTNPSDPFPELGTPQSLTVEATPTKVPYEGAAVNVVVVVTVEEGKRLQGVPVTYTLKSQGVDQPLTNTEYADATGRIEELFFINRESDLTYRAGALERTIHFTRGAPPPLPSDPKPPKPPSPPPPPPPPSPAPPSLAVSLVSSAAATDIFTAVTFTATAAPANGATAATSYAWDIDADGTTDYTTTTNTEAHQYTVPGSYTARVTATNGSQSGSDMTAITVTAPALAVSLAADDFSPTIGQPVIFTATVTSTGTVPSSLTFEWDETDDGIYDAVATSGSPSGRIMSFGSAGEKTVRVRVTDPATGRTATTTAQVTVT